MTELLKPHESFYQPTENELIALALRLGAHGDVLVPLTGGHHNAVYRYGDTVARYPTTASGISSLLAEFDLLLKHGGERLPKAVGCELINGTPVALIEFIEGVHKDFNILTPEEVEELAQAIFDIHSVTSNHFSLANEEKPTASGIRADYLRAMVYDGVTARLQTLQDEGIDLSPYTDAVPIITAGLQKIDDIIATHPEDFAKRTFTLLHHDLNQENVIWGSNGSVTFIDPCPTYGDPLDDLNYAVSNNAGFVNFQKTLLKAYSRVAQCGEISVAGMDAYTLKNNLDDLTWTIEMAERHPDKRATYKELYDTRLSVLRGLLGNSLGKY